uniref:Uncharacterized protein n=1 Tax=Tanacetum cinerariifolium TaxID=118510 RepID=A0A6L2P390_TANCI|nr:hypothetical protein [Tanacetum cinerariifolium]
MGRLQDDAKRLCLVDDLKKLKDHLHDSGLKALWHQFGARKAFNVNACPDPLKPRNVLLSPHWSINSHIALKFKKASATECGDRSKGITNTPVHCNHRFRLELDVVSNETAHAVTVMFDEIVKELVKYSAKALLHVVEDTNAEASNSVDEEPIEDKDGGTPN